jgi:transcriptional regulator with XRE-family HTH domain
MAKSQTAMKVKKVAAQTDDGAMGAVLRVGLQLRHARLVKGLRLREVAERSGYSESLISKIENNKATPSLNTLHRIARVLGKTIATLIGDTQPTHHGVVSKAGQRAVIPQITVGDQPSDGTEAEVMVPLGESALMGAYLIRVKPGGSSDGLRQHEGEEVGFIHTGELVLTVDGETYRLSQGDSFHFKSNLPHGFSNPGRTPTEIIWVNTPASL